MNIKAALTDAEQLADKAYGDFKDLIAKHRATIDDDLAAAVAAAAPLPPWARTMVADVVARLADSLIKQVDGEDKAAAVMAPGAYAEGGTLPAPPASADPAGASPSEAQPVSDS